jgi:hypothetical protein
MGITDKNFAEEQAASKLVTSSPKDGNSQN